MQLPLNMFIAIALSHMWCKTMQGLQLLISIHVWVVFKNRSTAAWKYHTKNCLVVMLLLHFCIDFITCVSSRKRFAFLWCYGKLFKPTVKFVFKIEMVYKRKKRFQSKLQLKLFSKEISWSHFQSKLKPGVDAECMWHKGPGHDS